MKIPTLFVRLGSFPSGKPRTKSSQSARPFKRRVAVNKRPIRCVLFPQIKVEGA